MIERLGVPVNDLASGIDVTRDGRLRPGYVLSNLLPGRCVLMHHWVVLRWTEGVAVLHGQRPEVGSFTLQFRLGVQGGYTHAALLQRRGLGIDALPFGPLCAWIAEEFRQLRRVRPNRFLEGLALKYALEIPLDLLIKLMLVHVRDTIVWIKLLER